MYEYYTAYKKAHTSGDLDTASKFSNQLRWEIARHAVGEEIVVYPLMEEHMGAKGKELADHDRQEHTVRIIHLGDKRRTDETCMYRR
jgi:iron-sulfur cluster repair protein YtfE (RIC family)